MTRKARIDEIVESNDIVLFMKGTALFPQCGFSSRAVAILDRLGASTRPSTCSRTRRSARHQGISDWPTIPQLYVKGEFVGGSDIMMEMFESGELQAAARRRAPAKTREGAEQGTREPLQPPLRGVEPSGRDYSSNGRAKLKKRRISAIFYQMTDKGGGRLRKIFRHIARRSTAVGTLRRCPGLDRA